MASSFVQTMVSQTMTLDVTRAGGAGPRELSALCTDLFLIVIRMREAEDLGDPASLRKLITFFLNLFEKNCSASGLDGESIAEAKYALVALMDETVLSIPGVCRDYWFATPMQLDLFGDNIAGEEFYNKLQKMLLNIDKKKDVLEVFYLCLSLGFEGKYKMFNGEERLAVMDDLGRKLRRSRIRVSTGLSPHGKRGEGVVVKRSSGGLPFPLWVAAVFTALLVVGTWLSLMFMNAAEVTRVLKSISL